MDNCLDPISRRVAPDDPAPIGHEMADTRPIFRLSDFVVATWVAREGEPFPCRGCEGQHEFLTHGCRPVAWARWAWENARDEVRLAPATRDSVPNCVMERCTLKQGAFFEPHQHEDFRWE